MAKIVGGMVVVVALVVSCATTPEVPVADRVHRVVFETGRDQDAAYRVANEWMVDMFTSAEAVIEYQDKAEGVIKGKATFPNITTSDLNVATIACTITVEVKDDRARVSFENMDSVPLIADNVFSIMLAVYNQAAHDAFIEYADTLVATLQQDMTTDSSDW